MTTLWSRWRLRAALAVLVVGVLVGVASRVLDGDPAKSIHVRWHPEVTDAERLRLEAQFLLRGERREDRTFGYDLLNDSQANIQALVAHPAVEDTHHIDRGNFTLAASAEFGESRTGWAWRWGVEDQLPLMWRLAGLLVLIGSGLLIPWSVLGRSIAAVGSGLREWTRTIGRLAQGAARGTGNELIAALGSWFGTWTKTFGRLVQYLRLPPRAPSPVWPRYDRAVVLGLAATFQVLYLLSIFLGFECDAASFYSFAKGLIGAGGVISPYRPPLFPAFLALTGTVWPGTFVGVVLVQAAMGVAMPLLVYRILFGLGRWPALIGAFALILSTTPFVGAKLILAEQLYAFLTLVTVDCLARYQEQRDPRAIYGFVLIGLCAMLTRWEAQFLVAIGLCAIVGLSVRPMRHLRHIACGVAIILVVLASYSTVRAWALSDYRLIGMVQSGSGMQLFQRVYNLNPADVGYLSSPYLRAVSDIYRSDPPATTGAASQFVSATHGPASKQLRDLVVTYVSEDPNRYRTLKPGLDQMLVESDAPPEGAYQELFGQFEGAPDALADNIFRSSHNLRTAQYPFFVATAATATLGLAAGDRLLRSVAIETIRAHPSTVIAMAEDGSTLTGISISAVGRVTQNPFVWEHWVRIFSRLSGLPGYMVVGFDMASCASDSLSPSMWEEYRFDSRLTSSSLADSMIQFGTYTRNLVRLWCGALLVFGWWVVVIARRRRALNLSVLATLGCVVVVVGVAVAGGNTKYDIGFMPLLVIAAVSIATESIRYLRSAVVWVGNRSKG